MRVPRSLVASLRCAVGRLWTKGGRLGAKASAVSGLRLAALCATSDSAPRPWRTQNARRMHWPCVTPACVLVCVRPESREGEGGAGRGQVGGTDAFVLYRRGGGAAPSQRPERRERSDWAGEASWTEPAGNRPGSRCARARTVRTPQGWPKHGGYARARTHTHTHAENTRAAGMGLYPVAGGGSCGGTAHGGVTAPGLVPSRHNRTQRKEQTRCTRGPRRRAEGPAPRVIGPGPGLGRAAPGVPHTETGGRQGADRWRSRGGVVVYWAAECSALPQRRRLPNQAQGDLPAARTQTLSMAEKVGPMRGATALEKPRAAQRRELLLLVDI